MSTEDQTFNINIFKDNKESIESSNNKSESYILLANEKLNNTNRDLIIELNELQNNMNDLENDNERMEKSITYQRGLLHNFNDIKNNQENMIKQYKKRVESNNKLNIKIMQEFINIMKIIPYTFFTLCVIMGISNIFIPIDVITFLITIIIYISSLFLIKLIFDFNETRMINYIDNYKNNEKIYQKSINDIYDNIKKITSKSDFIGDLIDNC